MFCHDIVHFVIHGIYQQTRRALSKIKVDHADAEADADADNMKCSINISATQEIYWFIIASHQSGLS